MIEHASGIERRITLRLLSYWEKLRKGRPMPTEQDINPEDIQDLWDNCFLIHVTDLSKSDYNYTFLGEAIAEAYNHGIADEQSGGMISPNAGKLTTSFRQIMETAKPLTEEGEFRNIRQEMVKYRQCLLPLGGDGKIEAMFGGMTFKIFPPEA